MAESRDRLSRAIDIAAVYSRRRSNLLGIYQDNPEMIGSPATGRGGFVNARSHATPRGRVFSVTGRENTPISRRGNGRGRGSNSVLPSWYPRTPLRDITAIVRAIERRRELLGGGRVLEIESPVSHAYGVRDSSAQSPVAHLEHTKSLMSPLASNQFKCCPPTVGKVPKILHDITNQASDDSEFVTPQKKLLNSIDTVEKEVMEELRKLKRTASAKRAEREKKVRTLMSLR